MMFFTTDTQALLQLNCQVKGPFMSEQSPVLSMPYIQPAQAQKHVTHNEALRILDAVTQLSVISTELDAPPAPFAHG